MSFSDVCVIILIKHGACLHFISLWKCFWVFYCERLVDITVLCFFAFFMFSLCSAAVGKRRYIFEGVLMLFLWIKKWATWKRSFWTLNHGKTGVPRDAAFSSDSSDLSFCLFFSPRFHRLLPASSHFVFSYFPCLCWSMPPLLHASINENHPPCSWSLQSDIFSIWFIFIPWRACQQRSCSDAFIHSFPWGQKFILSHPRMSFCHRHRSNTYRRLFVFYFNLPNVCEWCEGGLVPGISFMFDLEPN